MAKLNKFVSTNANTGVSTTYATLLLGPLADIIRKNAGTQDITPKSVGGIQLLTVKEIRDATANPQSVLKPAMKALAEEIKARREIEQTLTRLNFERPRLRDLIKELRGRLPNITIPVQQNELQEDIRRLEELYNQTVAKQKELPELKSRQKILEKRLKKQVTDLEKFGWKEFRQLTAQTMLAELKSANINLNEAEIADLLNTEEALPQILSRFQEQGIPVPKWAAEPDFTTYFKLKAFLVAHDYLERRQLPNHEKEVMQVLKKIKTNPQAKGEALAEKQKKQLENIEDDTRLVTEPLTPTIRALSTQNDEFVRLSEKYNVLPPKERLPGVELEEEPTLPRPR
jgi:hypothetical protein